MRLPGAAGRRAPPEETATTPIWQQYLGVKRRYPSAIVLFRLGDFYETFEDDAKLCARELGLTLTSRSMGKDLRVPLAGIPYHTVEGYLAKLVAKGYRVAVCEQMADPSTVKGLVPREVARVVTPGTVIEDALLSGKENSYLAVVVGDGELAGLARIDVSTGEFVTQQLAQTALRDELLRIGPREVLAGGAVTLGAEFPPATPLSGATLDDETAAAELLAHFGASTLEPFGCARLPLAICAAAAVLRYLRDNQPAVLPVITRLSTADARGSMTLDPQTVRNLEIFAAGRAGGRDGSLLAVLDATRTPMGARLLRSRLARPLVDPAAINQRLDAVGWLHERGTLRARVLAALGRTGDIERLVTRCAARASSPRDLANLRGSLAAIASVHALLAPEDLPAGLPALPDLAEPESLLATALSDEPGTLGQGDVIRRGFSTELDGLHDTAASARGFLADLEQRERARSGIKSLKIGYNRVFGYYIEISHANASGVPADYQRRQTLTGAERYVTPQLKEYEERVLTAQERLEELELQLFRSICAGVAAHGERLRDAAATVSEIDVAAGLAETAALNGYCRPCVDGGERIEVRDGRHPVVERMLPAGAFVSNDVALDNAGAQIIVLTGPNMAGKSTYLRQVAQTVLLAQAGSYVPAREAHVGVVDRIFTRVGAQDDLAAGASTFMVEMVETAQILHHCTPRSLIVLDEVGRGTSTYDGLAIARAVVEYLHDRRECAAKTLFATHYHELTALAESLPRVRNYTVAVGEENGEVLFLRTIVPGGADRSYGIHVAQLAGMPRAVVQRAGEILAGLERTAVREDDARGLHGRRVREGQQLDLFSPGAALAGEVAALDIDALTPLDAIRVLYELRDRARLAGG